MRPTPLALLVAGTLAGSPLWASTPIEVCPSGYRPAFVDVQAVVNTVANCPLLEDPGLRSLVDSHAEGSHFAYPSVPGTCVSGRQLTGTVVVEGKQVHQVQGFSESAQRFFAEGVALGNAALVTGLSDTGKRFASGAALTFVSMQSTNSSLKLEVLMSDRFTIDYSVQPFVDTEDFVIVGHRGNARVAGRLTGVALVSAQPGQPIQSAPIRITGRICLS